MDISKQRRGAYPCLWQDGHDLGLHPFVCTAEDGVPVSGIGTPKALLIRRRLPALCKARIALSRVLHCAPGYCPFSKTRLLMSYGVGCASASGRLLKPVSTACRRRVRASLPCVKYFALIPKESARFWRSVPIIAGFRCTVHAWPCAPVLR